MKRLGRRLERLAVSLQDNAAINVGQYWRFVTPAVLHGGWLHLAVNSASLNSLGPTVERLYGRGRYAAVYGCGAVGGCLFSYLRSPAQSVGASGIASCLLKRLLPLSYCTDAAHTLLHTA